MSYLDIQEHEQTFDLHARALEQLPSYPDGWPRYSDRSTTDIIEAEAASEQDNAAPLILESCAELAVGSTVFLDVA